jgi:hypothetical protein
MFMVIGGGISVLSVVMGFVTVQKAKQYEEARGGAAEMNPARRRHSPTE